MAAMLLSSTSSPVQTSRRSREGRSRPNLSKICMKTKMCSFHLRGMCTRAESCSFAHDPNEIQTKPDLCCTKLCPSLLSEGRCPQMDRCKFAHSEAELRTIDVESSITPSVELTLPEASAPSSVSEREVPNVGYEQAGSEMHAVPRQVPKTAPQVVSRLRDAAVSGELTFAGMVFHLTRIFLAVFETRPQVAERVKVPANALAEATVVDTWAEAGLDSHSVLTFKEFARLCALPSELMPTDTMSPVPSASSVARVWKPQEQIASSACSDASTEDSDTWSESSTDIDSVDAPSRATSGWQTPTLCANVESAWRDQEVKVVNTFIHVSAPSIATSTRRARSVPSRSGRAA